MRVLVLFVVMATLVAAPVATYGGSPGQEQPSLVTGAGNRFALDFYAQLAESKPGNLFFSPSSISITLTMAAAGARGQTQAEMTEALCLGDKLDAAHGEYRQLLAKWRESGEERGHYRLRMANRLWIQAGYPVVEDFRKLTREEYHSAIGSVDYMDNPERSRSTINQWVSRLTERKINDLLPKGSIQGYTRLVLTNAVYFKADWSRMFLPRDTRDQDFFVSAERQVKVPMMTKTSAPGYMETPEFQAIEMPYGYDADEVSMVVLLPREKDGLAALEKSLSADRLAEWLGALEKEKTEIFLPKFKIENTLGLNGTLKAMGMKLAFSEDQADLSGISTREDLLITGVAQKAAVAVDEIGTEAAVGTYTIMGATGLPQHGPIFRADHPFLFLIRDMQTGYIFFLGRLVDPSE
jgi:serpin B